MKDLFVLDDSTNKNIRAQLEEHLHVVQEVSPRMVILEGDPQDLEAARKLPGALAKEELAKSDLALTPGEKLFADAWGGSSEEGDAKRPFENYNWGTKGFSPP